MRILLDEPVPRRLGAALTGHEATTVPAIKGTLPFMKCYSVRTPRLARTVFAHVPHHITQRGNRREEIFFGDEDRETYLAWLQDYSRRHDVAILAYCLMSNHIHLVAVPGTEEALEAVLKPLHMRYAQRLNRQRGWKGRV